MRTLVAVLAMLVCLACFAVTPIPLTTTAGVCTFNADTVTATPGAFKASGAFGVGCPGYVAPPTNPPTQPATCAPIGGIKTATRLLFRPQGNVVSSIDATRYDSIFGWNPPGNQSQITPWPGPQVAQIRQIDLSPTGYIALKFRTSPTMTGKAAGAWSVVGTGSTVPITISVDRCPGVFDASGQKYCWAQGGEGQGVSYGNAATIAASIAAHGGRDVLFQCPLAPDTEYYMNIRVSPGRECGGVCSVSLKPIVYFL